MGGDYEYCHCGLKSGYIIFNNLDPSSSRILDSATCRSMFLTFPWTDRTPRICLIAEIKLTHHHRAYHVPKLLLKHYIYLSFLNTPKLLGPQFINRSTTLILGKNSPCNCGYTG